MRDERRPVMVRLPVPLIQRIGHLAVEQQQTKQAVIEELLEQALNLRERSDVRAGTSLDVLADRVGEIISAFTEEEIREFRDNPTKSAAQLWAIQAMRQMKANLCPHGAPYDDCPDCRH